MMMLIRGDPTTGDPPLPSLFREGVEFSFSILSIIFIKFQIPSFKINLPP